MPVTYNSLRSSSGFRSPGFVVSSAGSIDTSGTLTVSGAFDLSGELSTTANLITTQTVIADSLQLSSIAIEANEIRTSNTNQDLLLSVDGTGIIRLLESVTVSGILTISDATDATDTSTASVVLSGGLALAKTVRSGYDSYFNSVRVGKGNGSISTNTALGVTALNAITDGTNNIGVGYNALAVNETGVSNTALGATALDTTISGDNNVAVGYSALTANISGDSNTALGTGSLSSSTGNKNIAIGINSGSSLVTGNSNVIIGSASGSTIDTTSNNIIISDGDGNIRITIDNTGVTRLFNNVIISGDVTADDASANGHLVTRRQLLKQALAIGLFTSYGNFTT